MKNQTICNIALLFFLVVLVINKVLAVEEQDNSGQYSLFRSKTHVKNPLELRDPFKRRINKKISGGPSKTKNKIEGIYTDEQTSIEDKPLESIRIVGVVIGSERRAIAKVQGDEANVYYIKEGMKIGKNGAEVKAILPGGIVLVEKIRNIYDQDEYLETVIPVSLE